jgi:hypothetical protein
MWRKLEIQAVWFQLKQPLTRLQKFPSKFLLDVKCDYKSKVVSLLSAIVVGFGKKIIIRKQAV